ncbi:hypothetical protein BDFG_08364 [Blastomyces dermatitidis ATCC 26199]|nr:hypothetical protein BDFG_08364 [Blastomyces dermatitidis ATCC 26199]
MAPRKEKSDKESKEKGEDGATMILEYLRQQNRPYSAIDITANLHNKVSKAYTVKALKEMHERKEIEARVAGKQIVYHALQDGPSDSTPAQLSALDSELTNFRAQIASTKQYEKALRAELAALSARVPTDELREIVWRLDREKEEVLGRLAPLRDGRVATRVLSVEEQERVDGEWRMWKGRAVGRKRICREVWERCSEVLPEGIKKSEELWETLGLEGRL